MLFYHTNFRGAEVGFCLIKQQILAGRRLKTLFEDQERLLSAPNQIHSPTG